ncbi:MULTISPECIES: hypothetical protein [Pseudomonas]|uniref:hypothetical protein n=1 Tax=Pseudomonas TaxID=286 RepID=UPI001184676F|nr:MULTISPECIES: hypothetical protein [Pseudomonas]MCX9136011.1 hypothetical protein [Pseudomonas sp. DCB_PUT]MDD1971931.1 hypothetical protein [Pseudomonas putida]MDO1464103.1 hypothetical protein [Pseudomonas putida]MDO1469480.1 hypothetical protein [Pseudomonas putida]MDZ7326956.1 hypothetical protein [Pseudomonas sp. SDS3-8]
MQSTFSSPKIGFGAQDLPYSSRPAVMICLAGTMGSKTHGYGIEAVQWVGVACWLIISGGLESSPADEGTNHSNLPPAFLLQTTHFMTFGINSKSPRNWRTYQRSVPLKLTITQLLTVGGL